ncbi:hypothetical protein K0504_06185 [Neiella marina]|uniref:Uncharacterized protein n=1 Tax=Neiella holothuriorum TaxID=2870530 RepID=A0ABS7EE82_9GAMM|nr:hypothetical protein [Neiella holothuriorum]MBW8190621.1 hypothetical protein [Neiella holothuriorum]
MSLRIMDLFNFYSVGCFIRHGLQPDNPSLFGIYFDLAARVSGIKSPRKWSSQAYLQMARVFLDAACDERLAGHWRRQCLDQVVFAIQHATEKASSRRLLTEALRMRRELADMVDIELR